MAEQPLTVRLTIDLIIGTFCCVRGHTLLAADRDFAPMAWAPGVDARLM